MGFLDNNGLTYFYSKLKEKFIRTVNSQGPDASGNVHITNVPTADNLTSPDAQTSYDNFIYRTSGGSASLSSGPAQLMYIEGNIHIEGRIQENFVVTATNDLSVTYDAATWRTAIDTSGTYYFRYTKASSSSAAASWTANGTWQCDGIGTVLLPIYGLSVSNIINPSIQIVVGELSTGISAASVVPSTFASQISESGTYEFTYNEEASSWTFGFENITLSTYGISVTGTPDNEDKVVVTYVVGTPNSVITIVYTAPERGVISCATPTAFSATGFNQFDSATMYIENATISEGTITSGSNYIAYCRAKGGVDNGYVAYSENEYIENIGWVEELPDIGSTVVTTNTSVTSVLASVVFADDGYVVVEVTDMSDLCVHPKWSGSADTDYAAYVEPSVIEFPTEDLEENDLPLKTYGMPRIGAVADKLDLDAGTYVQKIGRLANTPANMSVVISYNTDYDYDDDYIYYVLPTSTTYYINISPDYIVNDWGTEEFIGTDVEVAAQLLYGQNLRDKLRTDVLTISSQDLNSTQILQIYDNLHMASRVNRNLINNWYFLGGGSQQGHGEFPINSRGQTSYSGVGYTIDGLYAEDSGCTTEIIDTGLKFSSSSNGDTWIMEMPKGETLQFLGKTLTLSILTNNNQLETKTFTIPTILTDNYSAQLSEINNIRVGFNLFLNNNSYQYCRINSRADNSSITLVAIKLEFGNTQTLAHKESGVWVVNEVPHFEEELIKCQTNTGMNHIDLYANKKVAYAPKTASVSLSSGSWSGTGPFTKTITISDAVITSKTKVDIQLDSTALTSLRNDGVSALYIVNNAGTLTAYSLGGTPYTAANLQVTYYETE